MSMIRIGYLSIKFRFNAIYCVITPLNVPQDKMKYNTVFSNEKSVEKLRETYYTHSMKITDICHLYK